VYAPNNSRSILTDVQNLTFSDGTLAVSDLASHTTVATGSERSGIVELYVAMMGRAPELSGFQYWEGLALDNNKTTPDLANIMFTLPEVQAAYPATMDQTSFINSIYQFVVGRAADASGLSYWQNLLSSGSVTRGELVMQMVNSGLNTPDGTDGKAYLMNRLYAAQGALELQESSGESISPTVISQAFTGINSDTSTVTTALTSLKGQISDAYDGLAGAVAISTTGIVSDGHPIFWVG
jgi:hypothetical protein